MSMNRNAIIIGIVAGEVSGDILGAGLMRSLRKYLKEVYFFGIGGSYMKQEIMESWYDMEELSVMGIFEVIIKLPRILNIRRNLINRFYKIVPDIFIGIDSPDFNIMIERLLKKRGIRTIHYVSPSIWAWRRNRIFDLQKATDNILVLFPFEKKIYDEFNIPCQFVGHSTADKIPMYPDKISVRQKLGIANHISCLALLPGSRMREIKMLARVFLDCIELLNHVVPNIEILVPLHNQRFAKQFMKLTSKSTTKFHILNNQLAWEAMIAADVALLASGTATLECMLAKCPMVVAYRMNPLTFMLIKYFVKVSWISLPNLLANYNLVQEFIQNECSSENLAKALISLLQDKDQHLILRKRFLQLHKSIQCNADEKAALSVLQLINS